VSLKDDADQRVRSKFEIGHVWTARRQKLSALLQHWSGAVTCLVDAAGVVAGPWI
jgi:hypothetical protein